MASTSKWYNTYAVETGFCGFNVAFVFGLFGLDTLEPRKERHTEARDAETRDIITHRTEGTAQTTHQKENTRSKIKQAYRKIRYTHMLTRLQSYNGESDQAVTIELLSYDPTLYVD
ncbi:hypothetical protein PV04_00650 [Phialophora macrospora]|uniref:Uncharacterized protein n=1 Tax=Phialophora macrospora TaxID=1851006 RepID=A0A0D2GJC2_9EURO|nr:hypothetical protein PV04_00650 [Phialophora macrospora]